MSEPEHKIEDEVEITLAEEGIGDATSFEHLFEILRDLPGNEEELVEFIEDIRDKAQSLRAGTDEEFRIMLLKSPDNKVLASMLMRIPHENAFRKIVLKLLRNEVLSRNQFRKKT